MMREILRQRYQNDPYFRRAVDSFVQILAIDILEAEALRDAIELAEQIALEEAAIKAAAIVGKSVLDYKGDKE